MSGRDPEPDREREERRSERQDRLDLEPRPRLRRITQQQVLVVILLGLVGLVYLTFRYAHRSLGRFERGDVALPSAPPLDPERIRAIGIDETAPRVEKPPEAPSTPVIAGPRRPAPARPRARDEDLARRLGAPLGRGSLRFGAQPAAAAPLDPTIDLLDRALERATRSAEAPAPAPEPVAVEPPERYAAIAAALRPAPPYVLSTGTIVPAVLLHRLHSSEPGLVRAQVTRDVYDSDRAADVLIPRGTLAFGRQLRVPRLGDTRVVVGWESLRYPDGRVLALPGEPTAAPDGALGATGRVRERWARRFGAAALLSIVGAAGQLSQPERSGIAAATPTPGEIAAAELGLETGRLANQILERYADLPPLIELAPGARISILLTHDLAFDVPAGARPSGRAAVTAQGAGSP